MKALVWWIWFFTYLFIKKTTNVLWQGRLTNFCAVICLMRWQKHSWLSRNKKTSPSHPLRKRGKRRGGKKKRSFWTTVYSIFNSQPDFLSRKQRSEWSTSVSMVKIDITSHCSAGTGELDPKAEPFGRCRCGEIRSPAQHKLQHQGNPSPTTHNSSRAHSPLPILISLPLAKESPQFPLPPRAAAFFFSSS